MVDPRKLYMNIDVLVIGSGGNGQTYFIEFLRNQNVKANHHGDWDGLKHLPSPQKIPRKYNIKKCIFLYNDPLKAIFSLFRRKFQSAQLFKLGNPYEIWSRTGEFPIDQYFNLVKQCGGDLFGIEKQFFNWYNSKLNFPIYFLDFNDILAKQNFLSDFIGVKLNFDVFKITKRKTNINHPEKKVVDIYNNLYQRMKNAAKLRNSS